MTDTFTIDGTTLDLPKILHQNLQVHFATEAARLAKIAVGLRDTATRSKQRAATLTDGPGDDVFALLGDSADESAQHAADLLRDAEAYEAAGRAACRAAAYLRGSPGGIAGIERRAEDMWAAVLRDAC